MNFTMPKLLFLGGALCLKVFKVKYASEAGDNDGKCFFVDYANQAGRKFIFC